MHVTLHVAPAGNDHWSGTLASCNAARTDGPLQTMHAALARARALRRGPACVTHCAIVLRGGRHALTAPLEFTPQDSGALSLAAFPGEQPIVDGGVRITQWASTVINGCAAWVADVRAVVERSGPFRSLFANGRRCVRARLPVDGFYWMQDVPDITLDAALFDGSSRFVAAPGDLQPFHNLQDAEIVVAHYWSEERMPIATFDPHTRLVTSNKRSIFSLRDSYNRRFARYYVDNVIEGLTTPGAWYLDHATGQVFYLPLPGETPANTEIVVPVLLQFLRFLGVPEEQAYVRDIAIKGVAFEYADWVQPAQYWRKWVDPYKAPAQWHPCDAYQHFIAHDHVAAAHDYANVPQGAFHLPGVLHLRGARNIDVRNCRVAHVGFYAVDMQEGCANNRVVGCVFEDLGAGGVKINGADEEPDNPRCTSGQHVTDNHLSGGGWVFPSACGIMVLFSCDNHIAHNEIRDFCYTGISCGWVWGYRPSITRHNLIEKNHIFDLGRRGALSDMGGIYLLGVQPGTCVRGNLLHDINQAAYGGWGIYPDQGSSGMLFEHNVVYVTHSHSLHEHWGRQNVYRNNIFAFGGAGALEINREAHQHITTPARGCTFERNIVIVDNQPVFPDHDRYFDDHILRADYNLYWDVANPQPVVRHYAPHDDKTCVREYFLRDVQALGEELHSLCADPKCADPRHGDFTLAPDSPALALGFLPINLHDVGPRSQ